MASTNQATKRSHDDDNEDIEMHVKRQRGEGPNVNLRLLLASKNAGAVIGKGGENIKGLRNEFKCQIHVPDCDGPERILSIKSDLGTVCAALFKAIPLFDDYKNHQDLEFECKIRLLVHKSQAGCIIGRQGSRIRELRDSTGTNIKVFPNCCPMSTERTVELVATPEVVSQCVGTIFELLQTAPPIGPDQPYDPSNFDDFSAADYGGFTMNNRVDRGGRVDRRGGNRGFEMSMHDGIGGMPSRSFRGPRGRGGFGMRGSMSSNSFGRDEFDECFDYAGSFDSGFGNESFDRFAGRGKHGVRGRDAGFGDGYRNSPPNNGFRDGSHVRGNSNGFRGVRGRVGAHHDSPHGSNSFNNDHLGDFGGGLFDGSNSNVRGVSGGFNSRQGYGGDGDSFEKFGDGLPEGKYNSGHRDGFRGGSSNRRNSGFNNSDDFDGMQRNSYSVRNNRFASNRNDHTGQNFENSTSFGQNSAHDKVFNPGNDRFGQHDSGYGNNANFVSDKQGFSRSNANVNDGNITSSQVSISQDMAGSIIGQRGSNIRDIRNETGAHITIAEPLSGATDRIVTIKGTEEQIKSAQYLMQRCVKNNM